MRVYVLQGRTGLYGFTPKPSNLPADKGPWRPFKSLEIYEDHRALRIGVNEADVLAGIKSQGYYLTDLTAQVPENVLFEPPAEI
jgi:hypothetical protein